MNDDVSNVSRALTCSELRLATDPTVTHRPASREPVSCTERSVTRGQLKSLHCHQSERWHAAYVKPSATMAQQTLIGLARRLRCREQSLQLL
jgi:hypothetical protein